LIIGNWDLVIAVCDASDARSPKLLYSSRNVGGPLGSFAGLDTNPADVLAEMERLRENLQLLITVKVMEILRPF
jgi:hypothetical protein